MMNHATSEPRDAPGAFRAAYDRRAQAYATVVEPTFAPTHRRIVELAEIVPDVQLLDVATGTGGVAREAASLGARVTGIDVSSGMLEIARQRSPAGIVYLLAEAAELPFPDGSVDVITCGFGLSHMPHANDVLEEVRRVLRPRGRLVASCWGPQGFNPSRDAVQARLARYLPEWRDPFAAITTREVWADAQRGLRILRRAGFERVQVATERLCGEFAGPEQALARAVAGTVAGAMADAIQDDELGRFRAEALAAIEATGDLAWWDLVNYYRAWP